MGVKSSKGGLEDAVKRTEKRAGKITVSGRYHRLPRKLTDDYVPMDKVLGSGYNGSVHLAKSKTTDGTYAIKDFKLHGVSSEKKEELETEAEIFLSMDHPHVARLTDVYESDDTLSLVMECMEGGELFHRVTTRKRFSEKDAAEATFQMLLAVNYIHSHDIVHRDIKLENFLYEKKDSDHLKLIDFGFSKIWEPNTKMALSCGTLAYVAPEVLEKSYTSQCDLWSLGVVVFILLVGYMPFAGTESHQVSMIKKGKYTMRKDVWAKVSKQANEFVAQLLVVDPQARMNAEKAINHPWIKMKREEAHPTEVDTATVSALAAFGQASHFRRACMQVCAWSLTNDERAQVRDAFLAFDTEKKGTIKINDFKKILEGQFHIEDQRTLEAFAALDTNHDDEIHYADFLSAMVSARIKLHDDLMKQTFRRFDTQNKGYVTVDELKEVLGDSISSEELAAVVNDIDTGHDGKIQYEEFINYLKNPDVEKDHHEIAHKVIDKELKSKSKGSSNAKMRQRTGLKEGQGGGNNSPAQKKQGGCCTIQ